MQKKLILTIGRILFIIRRTFNFFIKQYQLSGLIKVGNKVYLGNGCRITKDTLIGSNVSIGSDCIFQSTHGRIIIGDNVMFGPGVHIHGGNHRFDIPGILMIDSTKCDFDDGEVIIEDDVWIGARAIILKGVRIGTGSVVGAGSIVVKDVPPYSVYVGAPNQKCYPRWDQNTLQKHKEMLSNNNN